MENGIPCPYCGCLESTRVQRTVSEEESKKRYRKCIKCGNSFSTKESVVMNATELAEYKQKSEAVRAAKRVEDKTRRLTPEEVQQEVAKALKKKGLSRSQLTTAE